jgi:hypothetical protein
MSFVRPVFAFEQDVSCSLRAVAALAFVGFGSVDGVGVCPWLRGNIENDVK